MANVMTAALNAVAKAVTTGWPMNFSDSAKEQPESLHLAKQFGRAAPGLR
jgi:hypothetical protein